jgi:hypothetical protein
VIACIIEPLNSPDKAADACRSDNARCIDAASIRLEVVHSSTPKNQDNDSD